MRARGVLWIAAVLLVGCADPNSLFYAPPPPTASPAVKAYLDARNAQPTTFELADADVKDAWGRAQAWIAQNSGVKIQTATDYLIETYGTQLAGITETVFAYQVTRAPLGGGRSQISVKCTAPRMGWNDTALENAKTLALFMVTGKLPPQ